MDKITMAFYLARHEIPNPRKDLEIRAKQIERFRLYRDFWSFDEVKERYDKAIEDSKRLILNRSHFNFLPYVLSRKTKA